MENIAGYLLEAEYTRHESGGWQKFWISLVTAVRLNCTVASYSFSKLLERTNHDCRDQAGDLLLPKFANRLHDHSGRG